MKHLLDVVRVGAWNSLFPSQTWSLEYRAENLGVKSSKLQPSILLHKTHIYLWPIQLLMDNFAFDMGRNSDFLCLLFTVTRKNLLQRQGFLADWKGDGFVSLSMSFNQHRGAFYLRSKSYLFVKISAHILPSSMGSIYDILPLRLLAVCWHARSIDPSTHVLPTNSRPREVSVVETFLDVANCGHQLHTGIHWFKQCHIVKSDIITCCNAELSL